METTTIIAIDTVAQMPQPGRYVSRALSRKARKRVQRIGTVA